MRLGGVLQEKREAAAKAEAEKAPEEHLKIKLSTSILSSPSKRKQVCPDGLRLRVCEDARVVVH